MIGLILLVLLGAYIAAFVFVAFKAKTWTSRSAFWALLLAPAVLLTWDMPIGYVRFKAACEKEGGLKVLEPSLKQATVVRLIANDIFSFSNTGEEVLRRYISLQAVESLPPNQWESSDPFAYATYARAESGKIEWTMLDDVVEQKPVRTRLFRAISKPSNAQYKIHKEYEQRWPRLWIERYVLTNAADEQLAVTNMIGYAWTNRDKTVFAQTVTEYCGSEPGAYNELLKLIATQKQGK